MNSVSQHIALQVLVCTIGDEGIARVASSHLPAVAGVEYVVCWQAPTKSAPVPRSLAGRGDVRVLRHSSSGVSRNRNFAIGAATAPLALFGDDDVDYSAQGLACLIETARSLPDADIICCRHTRCGLFPKPYPESAVTVAHAPRGYYTTSFEIALTAPLVFIKSGVFKSRAPVVRWSWTQTVTGTTYTPTDARRAS